MLGDSCGRPDEAAAFVERTVSERGTALEIGAGVGNTAFALAAAGFQVIALEPDPEMYSILLARLALRKELHENLSPVPRAAGFDLDRSFDICTCFSVLHLLLEQHEREQVVGYAGSHLTPAGRFFLEIPVDSPQRLERPLQLAAERRFGDVHFQHFSSLQRLPDGLWQTVWKFSTSRCGGLLDEVQQSFTGA